MLMSHYHAPEDGFPNVEGAIGYSGSDADSTSSVVRKSPMFERPAMNHRNDPLVQEEVPSFSRMGPSTPD